VTVGVSGRTVTLDGRVGTEAEYQAAEQVVTDVLGLTDVRNNLVVDALRRPLQSEAADVAAGARAGLGAADSDGAGDRTTDEAQHLMHDTAGEQFGTTDVGESVEQGFSYHAPDTPVQEGNLSKENH
jgi:hypothetical protein